MCETEKERIMIPVKKGTNTLYTPRQTTRRRGRGRLHNRRTRSGARPATATRRRSRPPLKIRFVLRRSAASEMTPAEIAKCNHLLSGCFDGATDVAKLAPEDVCVIGMLGSRVVSFMCVREPENAADATVHNTIHTVCTAEQYRGRGLLRGMFHHVATLPRFKDRAFRLEASNIEEPDKGLNQTARFKIYSKTGFALPVGTEIRPSGEIVADVRISSSHSEFMYHLMAAFGPPRWVRADDMVIDACYANSEPQRRGCVMISNSKTMREFNAIRPLAAVMGAPGRMQLRV